MIRPARETAAEYSPTAESGSSSFDADVPRKLPSLDELTRIGAGGYDARLAYALSVVSAWSYSDGQTLANKLAWYGLPGNSVKVFVVANSALQVEAKAFLITSASKETGVLSFAGTEPNSFIDLLTDGNVMFKRIRQASPQEQARTIAQVHSGFYDSVKLLWGDLSAALQKASAQGLKHLYITGHSLGGAMAVYAGVLLRERESAAGLVRAVYTFGQPAVGDEAFAREGEVRLYNIYYRHRYGLDVVPLLPPRECGEFTHFGQEYVWDEKNAVWSTARQGVVRQQARIATAALGASLSLLVRRLPYTAFGRFAARWPLYSLDDHGPGNYLDSCRAASYRTVEAKPEPALLSVARPTRAARARGRRTTRTFARTAT